MPRDRRRRRRGGAGAPDPMIYASIQSQVWESVNNFRSKIAGTQGTGRVEDIQQSVQEMVEGIMNGILASVPGLRKE